MTMPRETAERMLRSTLWGLWGKDPDLVAARSQQEYEIDRSRVDHWMKAVMGIIEVIAEEKAGEAIEKHKRMTVHGSGRGYK